MSHTPLTATNLPNQLKNQAPKPKKRVLRPFWQFILMMIGLASILGLAYLS